MYKCEVKEDCLLWMMRYCITRSSYAVSDGVEAIMYNWPNMSSNMKNTIVKEIKDAIQSQGKLMHDCDVSAWNGILKIAEKESSNARTA